MSIKEANCDALLDLSRRLQNNESFRRWLIAKYWSLMFFVTRMIEKIGNPRKFEAQGDAVLYFGCGVKFMPAINSDLFAIHRYLKRRKCPELYLSGTFAPPKLHNRFSGIVAEHVLEHMLPEHGHVVLCNLWKMLKADGSIQISVPSPSRYVQCSESGVSLDILGINEIFYNHGHRFMYDERSLCALLTSAGFTDIKVNSHEDSPWKEYLSIEREPQSIYVVAKKPLD